MTAAARILVVDDDRSIRRTLEKFLSGEGYQVATAQDAPGAIAAAAAADLMLLDLGLPGGSGFDVLTALAERPRPPTVVVITARDDMQSTVKAIQPGAYEYLGKPIRASSGSPTGSSASRTAASSRSHPHPPSRFARAPRRSPPPIPPAPSRPGACHDQAAYRHDVMTS